MTKTDMIMTLKNSVVVAQGNVPTDAVADFADAILTEQQKAIDEAREADYADAITYIHMEK